MCTNFFNGTNFLIAMISLMRKFDSHIFMFMNMTIYIRKTTQSQSNKCPVKVHTLALLSASMMNWQECSLAERRTTATWRSSSPTVCDTVGVTSSWLHRQQNNTNTKGHVQLLMGLHLTAKECHFPYGITHVTCHPTQVNTPHLNPSQTGQ